MKGEVLRSDTPTAEQVYEDLLNETQHERARKSLQLLWAALQQMQADNAPDYSIARVGKYTQRNGGPRAQSIRNENGAKFRKLIDAVARTIGKPNQKAPAHPPSNVERAIELISDMGARVALKMMLEDRRRLQVETNNLRAAFKRLSVSPSTPDHISDGAEPQGVPTELIRGGQILDGAAIAAIVRFLEDDWLEERLWTIDPDGSISDEGAGGDMIAPPGFVDALQEVVRLSRTTA